MPTKRTKRGYDARAAKEHPGVTISHEWKRGQKRVVLRWYEVLGSEKRGKRKACFAMKLKDGKLTEAPAESRRAAEGHARLKAAELAKELKELQKSQHTDEHDPHATWENLKREHDAYLKRKRRRPKSISGYAYSWGFVERWPGRPALPKLLTLKSLESFAAHVADCLNAPASQASVLAHVTVILNFGRRRLKCVWLDADTINDGLEPPDADLMPVVLPTSHLKKILGAAETWDADHADTQTFPLLAFLMLTGARRGEAEQLRWLPSTPGAHESWVDFDGGRLLIHSSKTRRQRQIPFANRPALKKLLEVLHDEADPDAEPFVFGGVLPLAIADKRREEVVRGEAGEETRVRGRSLKRALTVVRQESGANWAIKSLRSTFATYMANSQLYGSDLYTLAGQNGHRYDVLVAKYAKAYPLPAKQRTASKVEDVLGIAKQVSDWTKAQKSKAGRIIRLRVPA